MMNTRTDPEKRDYFRFDLFGIPIINAGGGLRWGLLASGDTAVGLVASGRLAFGVVAIGAVAVGLVAAGAVSIGLMRAAGALAYSLKGSRESDVRQDL
jgi:hypothetical protein